MIAKIVEWLMFVQIVDWFLGKNIGEFCCFENVDLRFLLGSCCSVGSGR